MCGLGARWCCLASWIHKCDSPFECPSHLPHHKSCLVGYLDTGTEWLWGALALVQGTEPDLADVSLRAGLRCMMTGGKTTDQQKELLNRLATDEKAMWATANRSEPILFIWLHLICSILTVVHPCYPHEASIPVRRGGTWRTARMASWCIDGKGAPGDLCSSIHVWYDKEMIAKAGTPQQ